MSKFISNKLKEIDVGDSEWIKIPAQLSYEQVMKFTTGGTELESSKIMLIECIKEWNIKDDDGNIPEVNEENIMKLEITIITKISEEIAKMMTNDQDKKK